MKTKKETKDWRASHTKGPWRTEWNERTLEPGLDVWSKTGRIVAKVYTQVDEDEQDLNVALVTAAVDLLEACEELLTQMEEWTSGRGSGSITYWAGPGRAMACKAIAKAKGETV